MPPRLQTKCQSVRRKCADDQNHHGRHTRTCDRQPPRMQLPSGRQTSDATTAICSEAGRSRRPKWLLSRLLDSYLRTRRDVRGSRLTLNVSGPPARWRVSPTCQQLLRLLQLRLRRHPRRHPPLAEWTCAPRTRPRPIGLVVEAEHLTIFSFVLPFFNLHQTLSWHHWCYLGRKVLVRGKQQPLPMPSEPSPHPVRVLTAASTQLAIDWRTSSTLLRLCLMLKSFVASTCVASRATCACVLRLGTQRHECDQRRRKVS